MLNHRRRCCYDEAYRLNDFGGHSGTRNGSVACVGSCAIEGNTCPDGMLPELRFWKITVKGTASGAGWSWCINGPTYSVCDSNVAGPVAGSGAAAIAQAIVASINASGCSGIIAGVVQDSSFAIGSSCVQGFEFCIGPAGSAPSCCISELDPNSCSIDATFEQLDSYECFLLR